ncbi:unnamed protein product [Sphenostylis stenocarpa]|uniref:Uncharacterized protein n=1 Tax=Sphenostylis stenocarpa TaxID=92480 RepID=A0AA86S3L8_9FABA|nr:unnamed protein product [Sphenostylis stenocarpa]
MLFMVLWSFVREERIKGDDELHPSLVAYTHSKRKVLIISPVTCLAYDRKWNNSKLHEIYNRDIDFCSPEKPILFDCAFNYCFCPSVFSVRDKMNVYDFPRQNRI